MSLPFAAAFTVVTETVLVAMTTLPRESANLPENENTDGPFPSAPSVTM